MSFTPDNTNQNSSSGFVPDEQPSSQQDNGILDTIKNTAEGIANFVAPQTTKLLGTDIQNISNNLNQLSGGKIGTRISEQQANANAQAIPSLQSKAGLEALSYATPLEGAGWLVRAGLGGISGFLRGMSADNPTPQSVGTDTAIAGALNTIIPGLGNLVGKGLGRTSLGKGGEMLPEINKAVGGTLTGTQKEIGKNISNFTAPINDQLFALLQGSPNASKAVSRDTLYNLIDSQVDAMPLSQQPEVKKYVETTLKPYIEKMFPQQNLPLSLVDDALKSVKGPSMSKTLVEGQGANSLQRVGNPEATKLGLQYTPNSTPLFEQLNSIKPSVVTDYASPGGVSTSPMSQTNFGMNTKEDPFLSLLQLQDLKSKVGDEPKPSFWTNPDVQGVPQFSKNLTGGLKQLIEEKSGNPAEVARLNKLMGAAAQIRGNAQNFEKRPASVDLLQNLGPLGEVIAALGYLHSPPAAIGGLLTGLATHASTATPIVGAVSNPTAQQAAVRLLFNSLNQNQNNPDNSASFQ